MEFTLTDCGEHATRVIINNTTVRFVDGIPDEDRDPMEDGSYRVQDDITYSSARLLELIEKVVATRGNFGQIAMYGDTQIIVRAHHSQDDVIELHIGAMMCEGAGLCLPLSVVRAVLGGTAAASISEAMKI